MGRPVFQQVWAWFQVFSPRHTAAVCPTPCQPPTFSLSSPHLLLDFSASQSHLPKKLIDNPVWVWFHNQQMVSNLHRGPDAGRRP